jgi:ATP-binding cassette, subfamily F, member 3
MLITKELIIKNTQQDLVLVDTLSFTLNENDKYAIIGTEGSGKSTLLSVLKGENLPYITYEGQITRPNIISYLEQDLEDNWKDYTVNEYLSDGINNSIYDYYEEIFKLCDRFEFDYFLIESRKIGSFSGGEKVKIGLIKALMVKPDLLLLDEPSNDIDFKTLIFLEEFLLETSIPILFTSHDQRLLENVSNGIIHLQHINKKTKAKTYFMRIGYKEYKEMFFKKFESDMMKARKERSDYDKKMQKFQQIYNKVEYQQNQAVRNPKLAAMLKKKIKSMKSQERRYQKDVESFTEIPEKEESMNLFFDDNVNLNPSKHLLNLDIINFKLKNDLIIKEIKLSVKGNDKLVIIGDNGIGKTTLIKHIIEELKYNNIKYGYLSQNYLDILDDSIDPVTFLLKKQKKYEEFRLRQILGVLGLKRNEMTYQIKDLSEGTKLKVLLVLLICLDIEILVLDEPTRNISPINQDELYDLFLNFKGAIIAVTHDRSFIENVFDDIYELTLDGLSKK